MRISFIILLLAFFTCCGSLQHFIREYTTDKRSFEEAPAPGMTLEDYTCIETDTYTDQQQWKEYLEINLRPDSAILDTIPEGKYKVMVHFAINTDGSITDIEVRNDPGYGLAQKIIEVVADYPGTWHPAEQNGRKVKACRMQPVIFIVEEEDEQAAECDPALSAGLNL